MIFEQLLLQNHEVLIKDIGIGNPHRFQLKIPIYKSLLNEDISLDPSLANKVFPAAVEAWQQDIRTTTELPEDIKKESLAEFLKPYSIISKTIYPNKYQCVKPWGFCDVIPDTTKTGFARGFELNECRSNVVHINEDSINNSIISRILNPDSSGFAIDFSQSKINAYSVEKSSEGFLTCHYYGIHNPGTWETVNLLRIWAIHYLNAALQSAHKQGLI